MKPDQDAKIDFSSPATLKKWPSVNKERVSAALGAARQNYKTARRLRRLSTSNHQARPRAALNSRRVVRFPLRNAGFASRSADRVRRPLDRLPNKGST
jgi:hypothetical protein